MTKAHNSAVKTLPKLKTTRTAKRMRVPPRNPRMRMIAIAEAEANLARVVEDVVKRNYWFVITRGGKPAAILIKPDEGWKATIEIMSDPEFYADIRKGIKDLNAGKGVVYTDLDELFGPDR